MPPAAPPPTAATEEEAEAAAPSPPEEAGEALITDPPAARGAGEVGVRGLDEKPVTVPEGDPAAAIIAANRWAI